MSSPSTSKNNGQSQKSLITYGRHSNRRQGNDLHRTDFANATMSTELSKVTRNKGSVVGTISPSSDGSINRKSLHLSGPDGQPISSQGQKRGSAGTSRIRKRRYSLVSVDEDTNGLAQSRSSPRPSTKNKNQSQGQKPDIISFGRSEIGPVASATVQMERDHSTGPPKFETSSKPDKMLRISDGIDTALGSIVGVTSGQNFGDARVAKSKRRPRLIDALVAQRDQSPEPNPLEPHALPAAAQTPRNPLGEFRTPIAQRSVGRDARSRRAHSGEALKGRKIKFTYSHSRSLFAESQAQGDGTMDDATDFGIDPFSADSMLAESPKIPGPGPFAFSSDDEDGEGATSSIKIKSVHELRRAGANNRFSDEMEDLLSRIGVPQSSPSSMRRNALLELATKLNLDTFFGQFRDHGTRDKVAFRISEEKDPISGFALSAALVIFLSAGSAPSLLRQLADQKFESMIRRLFDQSEDIDDIASRRSANAPRGTKVAVHNIKDVLLRMKIWHGFEPIKMSPCLISLQLLDIFSRHAKTEDLEHVADQLEADMFGLAQKYTDPSIGADADYALILSILEAQSSVTTGAEKQARHIRQRSEVVAGLLQNTLRRWPAKRSNLDSTALKLAINTTNTANGASAFNDGEVLISLARSINAGFSSVQQTIRTRQLEDEFYDGLLLVLGVFINILEHCPSARSSVDTTSLGTLVKLYLGSRQAVGEVVNLVRLLDLFCVVADRNAG